MTIHNTILYLFHDFAAERGASRVGGSVETWTSRVRATLESPRSGTPLCNYLTHS